MKKRNFPGNETERIKAVQQYRILDTEEEQDFNDIVELASVLCDTPIAMITLVDQNRQWFKSRKGLTIRETHRSLSFCTHAIQSNDIMEVKDARQDERFANNTLVTGDPYIRFYAGMPLTTPDGYRVGTLSVIDRKPRELATSQHSCLRILGNQVMTLLNLRVNIWQRNLAETQLKALNKELNKQVKRKTAETINIFERVSEAFIALDRDWIITYASKKAGLVLNKPPGRLIGKYVWNEFPEAIGLPFHKLAEKAMETQQHQSQRTYYPPYDRWFENHIYPSPTGLSVYFRDVTEEHRSQLAIQRSTEIRKLIMDSALDAIVCIDTMGNVIFWNPQAENIFGWKREEMIGKHLADTIIPERYREQHERGFDHYKRTGEGNILNRLVELTAMNHKNEEFPIELTIVSVKQDGDEFFCAFIRDITERKEAEEKLKSQFEALRKANFELDQFVYRASHNLRAPLASILGLINVAQLEKLSPDQESYWEMVRNSVNRLDVVVQDILAYSSNARTELKISKIDFEEAVNCVLENFSDFQGLERLTIKSTIDRGSPFYSDRTRIFIILNNLISNSIKYQDLTKESSYLSLHISTSPKYASINISDNGIGIQKKNLDEIFNMFYRASENSKGSGLGLYITKETIIKLGGTIKVLSEYGNFTTFDITLPNLKP